MSSFVSTGIDTTNHFLVATVSYMLYGRPPPTDSSSYNNSEYSTHAVAPCPCGPRNATSHPWYVCSLLIYAVDQQHHWLFQIVCGGFFQQHNHYEEHSNVVTGTSPTSLQTFGIYYVLVQSRILMNLGGSSERLLQDEACLPIVLDCYTQRRT